MSNLSTSNGLIAKIDSAVFYIAKLNGIKDLKLDDRKFAVQWLQNNLGSIGVIELVKASEMALNGQLEVKTETYGTIAPKYLPELLREYRKYKKEKLKQEALKAPALPEPKTPQAEKDKIIRQELYDIFEKYKESKEMPSFCAGNILFDYAWTRGMTKYDKKVTNTIKDRASRQMEEEAEAEKTKVKNVHEMKEIIDKYQDIHKKAIFSNRCKKLYLEKYFIDLLEMQEEIKNFIK